MSREPSPTSSSVPHRTLGVRLDDWFGVSRSGNVSREVAVEQDTYEDDHPRSIPYEEKDDLPPPPPIDMLEETQSIDMGEDDKWEDLDFVLRFIFTAGDHSDSSSRINFDDMKRVLDEPIFHVRVETLKDLLRTYGLRFNLTIFHVMDYQRQRAVTYEDAKGGLTFVFRMCEIFENHSIDESNDKARATHVLYSMRHDSIVLRGLNIRKVNPLLGVLERLVETVPSAIVSRHDILHAVAFPFKTECGWTCFEAKLLDSVECTGGRDLSGDNESDMPAEHAITPSEATMTESNDKVVIHHEPSWTRGRMLLGTDPYWALVADILLRVRVDEDGTASIWNIREELSSNEDELRDTSKMMHDGLLGVREYMSKVFQRWTSRLRAKRVRPMVMLDALRNEHDIRQLWPTITSRLIGKRRVSYAHSGAGDWIKDRKRGEDIARTIRSFGSTQDRESLLQRIKRTTGRVPEVLLSCNDYYSLDEVSRILNRPRFN